MSVIVKGMEMPKDCYDCPLHDGETGRCNILGITVFDYIPKECPLVVEVVHCNECKYCLWADPYELWCQGHGYPARLVAGNDFCSKGRRIKEKEQ